MDKIERKRLTEIYKRCSDEDLKQFILEGEESFDDGVYELIIAEAQRRGIGNGNKAYDDDIDDKPDDDEVDHDEIGEEINFDEMGSEEFLGVLLNIHTLDELNFHLASAEAIRRKIDMTEIRELKALARGERNEDDIKIETIENPRPLIILNAIDEASLYTDTLDEEEIPFEIHIIVDDKNYKKAEIATDNILPAQDDE